MPILKRIFVSKRILVSVAGCDAARGAFVGELVDGSLIVDGADALDGTTIATDVSPPWLRPDVSSLRGSVRWVRMREGFAERVDAGIVGRPAVDAETSDSKPLHEGEDAIVCLDPSRPAAARVAENLNRNVVLLSFVRLRDAPALPAHYQQEPYEHVAQVSLLLVGAGVLGARVAEALLGWGFRRFSIVDRDYLERQNLPLFPAGAEWIGAPKARVVAELLRARASDVEANDFPFDVVSAAPLLRRLAARSSLMVVALDDVHARQLCNHVAVSQRVGAVYGALFRGGTIGEVLRYRPGASCLNCSRLVLPIAPTDREDDSPSRYRVGLVGDVAIVASLMARMAASLFAQSPELGALPADLALWSPIRQLDLDAPYRFEVPQQITWQPLPSVPTCRVCRGGRARQSGEGLKAARAALGVAG